MPKVAHLTFPKCGSQWVRDVLFDINTVRHGRGRFCAPAGPYSLYDWKKEPDGVIASPMYTVGYEQWKQVADPGDKALIVVRDPRDIIVSWAYSVAYSHFSDADIRIIRPVLLSLDSRGKLQVALYVFYSSAHIFRSWAGRKNTASEYIVKYEDLLADPAHGFKAIVDYFGWDMSSEPINEIVARHSFARVSKRQAGDSDMFSHYRNGVAQDWKNHFDREFGMFFEETLPGALADFGYEASSSWSERLPRATDEPGTDYFLLGIYNRLEEAALALESATH